MIDVAIVVDSEHVHRYTTDRAEFVIPSQRNVKLHATERHLIIVDNEDYSRLHVKMVRMDSEDEFLVPFQHNIKVHICHGTAVIEDMNHGLNVQATIKAH